MLSPFVRYFMAVAREGSVRQAAAKLHIAASAVNRQILEYEEQVGTELFERVPRGMRLTDAGRLLLETCTRLVHEHENWMSEIETLREAKTGHVTIGTLQLLAEDFFPPLLSKLLKKHPGITYSFVVGTSASIESQVVQGDIDIGMAWDPMQGAAAHRLRSARMPFGVALPKGHPLAALEEVRLQDCLGYPIVFPMIGELREVLDRLNLGLKNRATPVVETQSMGMLRSLVERGDAIALTSMTTVMPGLANKQIEFRPLKNHMRMSTVLTLFVRGDRKLPPAVALVAEELAKAFPSLP